jgi:hypothetical protein
MIGGLQNIDVPGEKRPERDINQPTTPDTEVEESVELYLYSPSMPCVIGRLYLS